MNVCPTYKSTLTADPVSFPHGYSFTPGVVTTVEPGYYKEGEFGVRTESLFVCKQIDVSPNHNT
jgi:hypothetical protein